MGKIGNYTENTWGIIEEAIQMADNYYCMIEAIVSSDGEMPSQGRDELYAFLTEHEGIPEVKKIEEFLREYDNDRRKLNESRVAFLENLGVARFVNI